MAFVDEDQGVVLLGQLADLPQGRDVTVHGEGTIGGHKPQAVFLREGSGTLRGRHPEERGWRRDPALVPPAVGNGYI